MITLYVFYWCVFFIDLFHLYNFFFSYDRIAFLVFRSEEEKKKVFIISKLVAEPSFHVAFYRENPAEWATPRNFFSHIGARLNIPEGFAGQVFDVKLSGW